MIGFVVNPVSGNGSGSKKWRIIENVLISRGIAYSVKMTQTGLDAKSFAGDFAADPAISSVVAVGGDGTVHETANGLFSAGSLKPLGYIPAGSGNDFALGFGIPSRTEDALEVILSQRAVRRADVLKYGDRIAVSSVGVGLDGRIALVTNTASYKKWLNRIKLGKLSYVLSLVRVLAAYKPRRITLTVDGADHIFDRVWLVATANIPYYGGGMMICPGADPADGSAEICVVSGIGRAELLAVFPRVYKGTHTTHPAVRFLRGSRIGLCSEHALDIHMDGETAGKTPIELEVVPAALSIIAP